LIAKFGGNPSQPECVIVVEVVDKGAQFDQKEEKTEAKGSKKSIMEYVTDFGDLFWKRD
jgi:hypothetical protein